MLEATITWTAEDALDVCLPGQDQVSIRDVVLDGSAVTACIGGKQVKCTFSQGDSPAGSVGDIWLHGKHFSFEFPRKLWEVDEQRVTGMIGNMLVAPMTSTVAKVRTPFSLWAAVNGMCPVHAMFRHLGPLSTAASQSSTSPWFGWFALSFTRGCSSRSTHSKQNPCADQRP